MRVAVLHRLQQAIKNDLIAGLLVVIPLATTIWLSISVSSWVLDLLTRIPKQVNPFKTWHPLLVDLLNGAVGIFVPLTGILLIGLMARNIFFIPSSPNPTTGWYVIASERDVRDLDISIEDAFKLIISGGIVTPGSVPTSTLPPTPASLR